MQTPSDSPFERYVRDKMYRLRRTPSDGLWDRIAARQKSVLRRRIFWYLLIRIGVICGVSLLCFWGLKHWNTAEAERISTVVYSDAKTSIDSNFQVKRSGAPAYKSPAPSRLDRPIAAHSNTPFHLPQKQFAQKQSRIFSIKPVPESPEINEIAGNIVEKRADPLNEKAAHTSAPVLAQMPDDQQDFIVEKGDKRATYDALLQLPFRIASVSNQEKIRLPDIVPSPVFRVIKPHRETRFQYGLAFTAGKLHESGNGKSQYFGAGLQVQYRLSNRLHLFGGLEWMQGRYRYDADILAGGTAAFNATRFPYLPPLPQGPPAPLDQIFQLQSDWKGLSMPLGAALYTKSPFPDCQWLLRAYYKPQLALQRKNRLFAPFTSVDNQLFEEKKQPLRAGWFGAQAGLEMQATRRLCFELTLNAEQALQAVNLEQVNYQAFSLRLAVFRQ